MNKYTGTISGMRWLAAPCLLAACASTRMPAPAHTSPLSPHAEEAPIARVATSLTSDPLADPLPHAHDDQPAEQPAREGHEHHHHSAAPSGGGGAAHDDGARAASETYVCPMHPDVRQSTPGTCPRCGMKLVPVPKPAPAPKPGAATQPHEHHAD